MFLVIMGVWLGGFCILSLNSSIGGCCYVCGVWDLPNQDVSITLDNIVCASFTLIKVMSGVFGHLAHGGMVLVY